MSPRPTIFISAVSKELKSARQLVANTLQFLGYEPVWQDVFGTEQGDLRAMLRAKIDSSKGVVQLVGKTYGAEPPDPDEQFGRVSYTQYEALYARQRGKKVWYLFLDEDFPADAREPEPEPLRELQATYHRRLKAEAHLYHPLNSREALEAGVLKMRDDLTRLRRSFKQWAFGVAGLLILLTGLVFWVLRGQQKQTSVIQKQGEQVNTLVDRYQKMEQALEKLAEVESHGSQAGEKLTPEEQRVRAYAVLEKNLGLASGSLARELPAFALVLYNRADTTPLVRARAAYALNKYEEAEKLSVEAATQDRQAYENAKQVADDRRKKAIEDFVLAGQSADRRIQYADAVKFYREAAALTDRTRAPVEWALQQWKIATVIEEQGDYAEAEKVFRAALAEFRAARPEEDVDFMLLRNNLANVLFDEGKFPEAETEHRAVAKLESKVLGPEDPDTLNSRNNLANTLLTEGKLAEAETEHRAVLALRNKVQGPEHPDTLQSRANLASTLESEGKYAESSAEFRRVVELQGKVLGTENPKTLANRHNLANSLDEDGKYAESVTEYQEVIRLKAKVIGPEHPDTLLSRNNLGTVLDHEGKFAEAEKEDREVLALEEKIIGPEHPNTIATMDNLANVLDHLGNYAAAETEFRDVIKLERKVFGPEHPDTLISRTGLAVTLGHLGRNVEAEAEFRDTLVLREKVLGPSHPDTLEACYHLASCLKAAGKIDEAKVFAQRAAEGAIKVLGPSHPDTLKYEKLRQELQTASSPSR